MWLAARADGLYQRRVALKLLRPGTADSNLRLRFSRERQILARLAHPHIARLLDAGISSDGLPYLALEYVEGEPITDYCRNHQLPLEQRLRMFHQICDAVSHAHANLIVHRDLKPSNILVTPSGDVRLLDFGIAKLLDSDAPMIEQTRTGVRAFTLHYAAPEQVRGEPVTTMTDVYALGVVLFELLTDTKPYRLKRQTDAEWEEAILAADPQRPSHTVLRRAEDAGADVHALRRHARMLSGDLDNIVLKTLSKRPEHRYPSVEALALDLSRYEAGRPVQARPQNLGYRFGKYLRRHRWALATGTLVAVVLTAALAIVAWQARQAVAEAGRAQAMQDFMVGVFESARGTPEGQALDLRGLLDDSLDRGNRELALQPRARAELLGVIARLRIGLGDYREALVLLNRQAGVLETAADAPVSLQLESLTQRGEALRLLGEPRQCIGLMQPALPTARREQAQLPPQVSEFYSQLGRCRRDNGERQGARQLFERSLTLRRDDRDDVGTVENLIDLANLQADAGQSGAALQGYQQARTQLQQKVGARHALMVEIGSHMASLQQGLEQIDAAEQSAANAFALGLEVYGAQHPATLSLRRQLAGLHIEQGRYAMADRELREAIALQQRRVHAGGDPAETKRGASELGRLQRQLGLVAWERGDNATALASMQHAVALARREEDNARLADALFDQARLLRHRARSRRAQVADRSARPAHRAFRAATCADRRQRSAAGRDRTLAWPARPGHGASRAGRDADAQRLRQHASEHARSRTLARARAGAGRRRRRTDATGCAGGPVARRPGSAPHRMARAGLCSAAALPRAGSRYGHGAAGNVAGTAARGAARRRRDPARGRGNRARLRLNYNGSGGCTGSIVPSPLMTFLYSARDTDT